MDTFLASTGGELDITQFALAMVQGLLDAVGEWVRSRQEREALGVRMAEEHPGFAQANRRQQSLVLHAIGDPGVQYALAFHRIEYGVVYETARTDLAGLEKGGFLSMTRAGRAQIYHSVEGLGDRLEPRLQGVAPKVEPPQDRLPVFY